MYLAAAGLLLAGGVVIRNARPIHDSPHKQILNVSHAVVSEFVYRSYGEGVQASFGGEDETVVEPQPGQKFRISGWVDLVSTEGQHERQTFSCLVYRDHNGSWVGEEITLTPQM